MHVSRRYTPPSREGGGGGGGREMGEKRQAGRDEGWAHPPASLLPLHLSRDSQGAPAAGIEELVARISSPAQNMERASCRVCLCVRVYSEE